MRGGDSGPIWRMSYYLTKSDYKVARTCATKLYYKKLGYPTNSQMTPYMKTLSEGGFMLAKMARLLYPEGIEIGVYDSVKQAIAQTQTELKKENVTLFEPVIYSDRKLVRIDILIKKGNQFQLIEVKSKQFDSLENQKLLEERGINIFQSKRDGKINSMWRPYIQDLAYQTWVLEEMLTAEKEEDKIEISPHLLLPDRAKTTQIDRLASYFQIREIPPQSINSKFSQIQVDFTGDLAKLQQDHILTLIPLKTEVAEVMNEVQTGAQIFLNSLSSSGTESAIAKIPVPISKSCKNCEFHRNDQDERDGFGECWGELANVEPHILDLYQMGRIGGNATPLVNELISKGKVSLYDMPEDALSDQSFLHRQLVQIEYTQKNQEWFSPHLKNVMGRLKYPLHFIDFETSRMSLPYHANMRSNEQVAFQWSCHTIHSPESDPIQTEWLNLEDHFPNFAFAEALMAQIGTEGTVFTWATHENSVLRDIYYQMVEYKYENEKLKSWLLQVVKFSDRTQTPLVDMNALTLKHYFHPRMKSRTSLKYVLPAIWQTQPYLHNISFLKSYFQQNDQGEILSPYQTLPKLAIGDQQIAIREGTEAMLAYQDLIYGKHKNNPGVKAKWRELLSQYCRLDTMAMVIIWLHWQHSLNQN
jgi:Domain of unknown function(DUF2779)